MCSIVKNGKCRLAKNSKRLKIGLLFSSIEENCQSRIWSGVVDRAKSLDIDLTLYLATFQQKAGQIQEHFSVVFDALNDDKTLDGLIVLTGFIAEDVGNNIIESFIKEYTNSPILSIASVVDGYSSVRVNNDSGIYDVVSHLIEHHNFTKIAFIKGPDDHIEAKERFIGYSKALKDHNIQLNKKLIFPGHFSDWSGEEAVAKMYDSKIIDEIEAISCADDYTALGVLKELSRRGKRIPKDIALTGFDNEDYSEIITPSLTTVQQPFFEIGSTAISELVKDIKESRTPSVSLVGSKTIYRQSCGCVYTPPTIDKSCCNSKECNSSNENSNLENILCDSYSVFGEKIPKEKVKSWITHLYNLLTTNELDQRLFLKELDLILIEFRKYSSMIIKWEAILNGLLTHLKKAFRGKKQLVTVAETLQTAIHLVYSAKTRDAKYNTLKLNQVQWEIRGIAQELVTSFDIPTLKEKLIFASKELDIEFIHIFIYDSPKKYSHWKQPDLVEYTIGIDNCKIVDSDEIGQIIPIQNIYDFISLVQEKHKRPVLYMPLFFGEEQTGVLLLGYKSSSPIDMYETIRINVATAIKGATLFQQIEHQSITDELTQLYNRRGFISFANSRLLHLRRDATPHYLFFIDMDGLKLINDKFGHQVGDDAISTCARLLKSAFRESDIIGRMGGDEFTVLASKVDKENSDDIVGRVREAFKEFNQTSNLKYEVECSIGSYEMENFSEEAFNEALQKADELLYQEKREKRKKGKSR